MSKLGVIHYPFKELSLREFLQYAARTGFGCVELRAGDVWDEQDCAWDPEATAGRVRAQLDQLGLRASALSCGNDFVVLDPAEVRRQVERTERIMALARILGAPCLRMEGGGPKDCVPPGRWAEAIAGCLERVLGEAERTGIALAVDNHGTVTNAEGVLAEVFRRVESPLVGANLDTYNWRWFGHDLETVRRLWDQVIPRTLHVHLKDGVGARQGYEGRVLGEGELGVADVVARLKAAGYEGVWCAEYEGREGSRVGYARCLQWMKANL